MCCDSCTNHSISRGLNPSISKTRWGWLSPKVPSLFPTVSWNLAISSWYIANCVPETQGFCGLSWAFSVFVILHFFFLSHFWSIFFSCNLKTILCFQSAWFFSSHQKVIPDIPTPNYPNVHQQNGEINWVHSFTETKEKTTTATWINLDMTLYWAEDTKQNLYLISFQCSPRTR